jgi:hypothetical protein
MPAPHEIAPGLWHWTARHPRLGRAVSSYYLMRERVLLDPLMPPHGERWFHERDAIPEHVLLTNRHHDRHSWRLRDAFGCEVHCIDVGAHEIHGRGPFTPFSFGDTLPGGVVAHEVGEISPDETALFVPAHAALAVADGVVRMSGPDLEFVPDALMDDPDHTKSGLLHRYRALLALDFKHLLLAHGSPIVGDGKQALADFVSE